MVTEFSTGPTPAPDVLTFTTRVPSRFALSGAVIVIGALVICAGIVTVAGTTRLPSSELFRLTVSGVSAAGHLSTAASTERPSCSGQVTETQAFSAPLASDTVQQRAKKIRTGLDMSHRDEHEERQPSYNYWNQV